MRRNSDIPGLTYLKKHIGQLQKLKHNLTQITIVVPHNPDEPEDFREYLNSLKDIVVLDKSENVGASYGCWSWTYLKYKNKFDYYIFMEDDYYFIEDNFDKTMVEMYESSYNCGYLCGFVSKKSSTHWPGNSNGIISSKVFDEYHKKAGGFLFDSEVKDGEYTKESGQISFGKGFTKIGYKIHDITSRYGCLHWYWQDRICRLIPRKPPQTNDRYLFVPYEYEKI